MSGDQAQYKNYRNTISKLTRINKKQYYSQFFGNNLKNMQKTWVIVKKSSPKNLSADCRSTVGRQSTDS